jgi:hypothetical protein
VIDIDEGLYNFLSPKLLPLTLNHGLSSQSLHTTNNNEDGPPLKRSHSDPEVYAHGLDAESEDPKPLLEAKTRYVKPEWFQKGFSIDVLLSDAESLNWICDPGAVNVDDDDNFICDPLPATMVDMNPSW